MSECVVRMEMPKSCRSCPLCHFVGSSPVCSIRIYPLDTVSRFFYADERPSKCPILCQLPEGHGRLGDLDELAAGCDDPYWCRWLSEIEDAPTIVPAEAERS